MSAIRLNGQYCLLRDIEKKDFAAFVNLVLPKITATEPIPHTAAGVVASLVAEGKSESDPVVQAGLQSCASLGIKNMWVDGGAASVTEETPTDAAAGLETAFGFAAVQSGLALAAAMCNAFRRKIRVNEQGVIEDAKFKCFGCGSAIASSSLATEWIKGKSVDEALAIKNTQIVEELSLPPVKIHCSVLAEDSIRSAIADYKKKNGITATSTQEASAH